VAATATAPLDVLRTRLQSDYYQAQLQATRLARGIANPESLPFMRASLLHIRETFQILFTIPRVEGWRGLFKGLGPNLIAIVPARGIHFYTYGNSKKFYSKHFNGGKEAPWIHLCSAVGAGIVTGTATNPIWVIKTRLQLDKAHASEGGGRKYRNAFDCLVKTVRHEGVRGLYRGLSASFLGISETAMQWVLYEDIKRRMEARQSRMAAAGLPKSRLEEVLSPFGDAIAGGGAKFVAAFLTYPHEASVQSLKFNGF
jgi:solute carrier family 25 protein 33/36